MTYWIDMDGVLAIYERDAYAGEHPVWLHKGSHYYRHLQPDPKMIEVLRALDMQKENHVCILSTLSNKGAMFLEHYEDKAAWLKEHCPFLDVERQFVPVISSKRNIAEFLKVSHTLTPNDVLIDDFNKNLIEWQNAGGAAIKYNNGINSTNSFNGLNLSPEMTASEIVQVLNIIKRREASIN